tara:strand:+ start:1049 stop:1723 length:675 start_codon:yes stop_codon:yes gene_type:complete
VKIKCLYKGSIELMNHTPDGDLLVVNAARCSFAKEHEEFSDGWDDNLIKYLAKHKHVLPFRHPSATLRIVAPVFVLRQLGKHQVGFSWSEVSRRYISDAPDLHHPLSCWRERGDNVKQGSSSHFIELGKAASLDVEVGNIYRDALSLYDSMLKSGVCPEQARMILPQSMMTTTVTTGTLLAWNNMYNLRTEGHTQEETQVYARAIGTIMSKLFPISWEALCEHS